MNDRERRVGKDEFSDMREMLRDALPALAQPELRRDLWPQMLRRMEERGLSYDIH